MLGSPMSRSIRFEVSAFSQFLERFGSVAGGFDLVSRLLKERRQHVPESTVVVNEKNAAMWDALSHEILHRPGHPMQDVSCGQPRGRGIPRGRSARCRRSVMLAPGVIRPHRALCTEPGVSEWWRRAPQHGQD